MAKVVYITLGFIFTVLGSIGVMLPLLPTTPFLLAAAFCFARGSERFHGWFKNTALYRRYLEDYAKNRAMSMATKTRILAVVSVMLLLAFTLADSRPARLVIIGVAAAHCYYFLFKIKTMRTEKAPAGQKRLLFLSWIHGSMWSGLTAAREPEIRGGRMGWETWSSGHKAGRSGDGPQ